MGVRGPKTKNKTRLSLQQPYYKNQFDLIKSQETKRSLKDARKQQMFLQQTQTTNENSMQV